MAVLVIAEVADAAGLFDWIGARMGGAARSGTGLFALVSVAAVGTTTALSLDATAALLTPVVLRTARRAAVAPDPHALATVQLANGASLLLPIANLTNLLVWSATGLSFTAFAARMALPTVGSTAAITGGLWWRHRRALSVPTRAAASGAPLGRAGVRVAVALALLLVLLCAASLAGVDVAWVALGGAAVLGTIAVASRAATAQRLLAAVSVGMVAFVAGLAVVVALADEHGLGEQVRRLVPAGSSLAALAAITALAALLANLVNNLPAALVLLVAIPHGDAPALLAALLGLNIGPNLTPTGSLATLLWRRAARREAVVVPWREVLVSAALTTPVALALGVGGLWVSLR